MVLWEVCGLERKLDIVLMSGFSFCRIKVQGLNVRVFVAGVGGCHDRVWGIVKIGGVTVLLGGSVCLTVVADIVFLKFLQVDIFEAEFVKRMLF